MSKPPFLIKVGKSFYRLAADGEEGEGFAHFNAIINEIRNEAGQEPAAEEGLGQPAEELRQLKPLTPEEVEEVTNSALEILYAAGDNAEQLLQRGGIKYNTDIAWGMAVPEEGPEGEEKEAPSKVVGGDEGVEVSFNVAVNNLSRNFQDEPLCVFDYRVFDKESHGFWAGLWNSLKTATGFGGNYQLHEFIFHFCTHNFGAEANDKTFGELLAAIGFIQNPSAVVKLNAAARLTKIEDNMDEVAKLDAVTSLLAEIMEEEQEAAQAGEPITKWDDPEQAKRTVDRRRQRRLLTQQQQKTINDVIDANRDSYMQIIKEAVDKTRGGAPAAQGATLSDRVEKFIRRLTESEGYTGGVRIHVDLKTAQIVAEIDAPYAFRYYVKKQPGGKLELEAASMKICDYEFLVDTEENAKALLAHDVTFGIAYNAAVNPKHTKRYAKNDLQAIVTKLAKQEAAKQQGGEAGGEVQNPMGQ